MPESLAKVMKLRHAALQRPRPVARSSTQ